MTNVNDVLVVVRAKFAAYIFHQVSDHAPLRAFYGRRPFVLRCLLWILYVVQILKKNWSFSPGTAEPLLRFDAPKTQTVLAELGLRGPKR